MPVINYDHNAMRHLMGNPKPHQPDSPKSLRDDFAMAALKELIIGNRYTLDQIAEVSYKIADAMMEARKK